MAMAGMDDAALHDDGEAVQRWIHCLSQLSNTYVRVSLDSDIEDRIKTLESNLAGTNGHMQN
jgi:hypothetical protein